MWGRGYERQDGMDLIKMCYKAVSTQLDGAQSCREILEEVKTTLLSYLNLKRGHLSLVKAVPWGKDSLILLACPACRPSILIARKKNHPKTERLRRSQRPPFGVYR